MLALLGVYAVKAMTILTGIVVREVIRDPLRAYQAVMAVYNAVRNCVRRQKDDAKDTDQGRSGGKGDAE